MFIYDLLKLAIWLALLWVNLATFIPKAIYRYFFSEHLKVDPELVNNTIFVGGAFSLPTDEITAEVYWRNLNGKVCWMPKIGPIASPEDGACELLASLLGLKEVTYVDSKENCHLKKKETRELTWLNKLKLCYMCYKLGIDSTKFRRPTEVSPTSKINIVTHSNGFSWASQFLVYLHYHRVGMIKQKLSDNVSLTNEETNILGTISDLSDSKYSVLFYDDSNKPINIGPECINKLVFISPPAGGLEYIRTIGCINEDLTLKKYGTGWLIGYAFSLYNKVSKYNPFNIYDVYLDQFEKVCDYSSGTDGIHQSWVEPVARKRTDTAMKILQIYNIKTIRIVTESSVKIFGIYLSRPFNSIRAILGIVLGCGWVLDKKYGPEYSQTLSPHDGTISLRSQLYGHHCKCAELFDCSKEFKQCKLCKSMHVKLDHFSILFKSELALHVQKKIFEWLLDN